METIRKIAVVGPGIVGMPMAALLARAQLAPGAPRAQVVVVQRASRTSGWKVDAVNRGESPIGGVEPSLDAIVAEAVRRGVLGATHEYGAARDADAILVCVQTDKTGNAPNYGPLIEALTGIAQALRAKPAGLRPLIIIESTLAPSSMATTVREHFASYGLEDGRDVLLGNSPNRVMPGRLVERVAHADKIVAGMRPETAEQIASLYATIVTHGVLHRTNSLTAEVVKTLENAYRDVRIAYASEVARWSDERDIDFFALRDAVNERVAQVDAASSDGGAVPTGALLVPTLGVGGHCLPKDGILLWWRALEHGVDPARSLILAARRVNDTSPAATLRLAERAFGPLARRRIALLGVAYRFDSEDTRNSPTLALARLLLGHGCEVTLHDPFVRADDQNLERSGLTDRFTRDLDDAMARADFAFVCTAHRVYRNDVPRACASAVHLTGLVDACNLLSADALAGSRVGYTGIGRGRTVPPASLVDAVHEGFQAVERGVANEVAQLVDFLNERYASTAFNRVDFREVQRLAATCATGCRIVDPGSIDPVRPSAGPNSELVAIAMGAGRGTGRGAGSTVRQEAADV